jgi:predicted permease
MRAWDIVRLKVRALVGGTSRDRADRDEMQAHLDGLTAEFLDQGLAPGEARARARREFGGLLQLQEASRDARGLGWLTDAMQDARHAMRMLRRTPGFAIAAIVTLALGLGANTAIFSLVDAVLLRELPVARPHELVFIETAAGDTPPYPYLDRLRVGTSSFAEVAGVAADELRVEVDGQVEQVYGQIASGSYFDLLEVRPVAGRLLTRDDEALAPAVAVIGYSYWQRRFGGDPHAIGKTVTFGDRRFTIVGVTPPGFWGLQAGRHVDLTLPITEARDRVTNPDAWGWFLAVARVKPSVAIAHATVEADAIFQAFVRDTNQTPARRARSARLALAPASHGTDGLRLRFSRPLVALTIIAATVLLIACANIGNLLLVRGVSRGREYAVRVATGATRGRLVRQALTETLVVFLAGAAAGLVVASASVRGLTAFFGVGRNPIVLDVHYDWTLAAYAGVLALIAGLVTGIWPAFRAARTDPHAAIKDGESRLAGSRRTAATGRVLVAAQMALSLAMLVSALVFVRTMANLRHVDLGFSGTRVLTMSLDVVETDGNPDRRGQLWRRALEEVRRVPGITAASLSVLTPLSGRNVTTAVTVAGRRPRDEFDHNIHLNHVSEDYFRTFGIDLTAGRAFTPMDAAGAPRVAVINEAAARHYFPGRSPIGETLGFGARGDYQIVGVVRDHKHQHLRQVVPRFAFVPIWQPVEPLRRLTLSLSSQQPSVTLVPILTAIVRNIDPKTLVSDVIGVQQQIDATLTSERLLSTLATAFAVLAVGLAAIGLYGVLGYSVARRRVEFGVRLALGARPASVARDAVRGVAPSVLLGLGLGLLVALPIARAAEAMLFGVAPGDPTTYALAVAMLMLVAVAAAWVPARRAARTDPLRALRTD